MNRFISIATMMIFGLAGCMMQTSYEDDSDFDKTSDQKTNNKDQILSPLKQIKIGIKPEDVKCKDRYNLILNMTDKSPAACLKPETALCVKSTTVACLKPKTAAGREFHDSAIKETELVLRMNTLEGVTPLTVGFLLNGVSEQFYSKTWFFGDGLQEGPTFSNIENHSYRYNFDNTTETSHTFHGYVSVTEYQHGLSSKVTTVKSFNVTVLKNTNKYISNFNQYQGIIHKDDSTAFSIATNTKSWTGWNFEKSGSSVSPTEMFSQNEHHKYSALGIINGSVSVTPITGRIENVTEYWNFSVLVVPRTETTIEILEREGTFKPERGYDQWHVMKPIKFYVDRNTSSYGRPLHGIDPDEKSKYEWNFGDNTKIIITSGVDWPFHKYEKPGSYLVKCNATFDNLKFQLSKTVYIIPS